MGRGRDQRLCCPVSKPDRRRSSITWLSCFKDVFFVHVQKRVLPLHPHLLISVIASRSPLAALLAVLQPGPSPLAHSRSSPAVMLGHSTQPCLPWQATRRGCVVVRYSLLVLYFSYHFPYHIRLQVFISELQPCGLLLCLLPLPYCVYVLTSVILSDSIQ
ncbi:hypothetical protein P346_02350 [Enterobacter sp. DC1]|nr:hypothetical protein P346_02350 [Enterobacter sp. DC1]